MRIRMAARDAGETETDLREPPRAHRPQSRARHHMATYAWPYEPAAIEARHSAYVSDDCAIAVAPEVCAGLPCCDAV